MSTPESLGRSRAVHRLVLTNRMVPLPTRATNVGNVESLNFVCALSGGLAVGTSIPPAPLSFPVPRRLLQQGDGQTSHSFWRSWPSGARRFRQSSLASRHTLPNPWRSRFQDSALLVHGPRKTVPPIKLVFSHQLLYTPPTDSRVKGIFVGCNFR